MAENKQFWQGAGGPIVASLVVLIGSFFSLLYFIDSDDLQGIWTINFSEDEFKLALVCDKKTKLCSGYSNLVDSKNIEDINRKEQRWITLEVVQFRFDRENQVLHIKEVGTSCTLAHSTSKEDGKACNPIDPTTHMINIHFDKARLVITATDSYQNKFNMIRTI